MLDKRQAIGNHGPGLPLDIAGIFLRPRELQQLGDDLADPVDLFVDQAEFGAGDVRLLSPSTLRMTSRLP